MNKPERMVADILEKNGIKYKFQFFLNKNGICKSYDFKILKYNIFIEIDGDYWHGGPGHKYKSFHRVNEIKENDNLKNKLAEENGYKIIHIWESEIKKDPNIILERLKNVQIINHK